MLDHLGSRWLRMCVPLLACVALVCGATTPAYASATSTQFTIDFVEFSPCANCVAGELVECTGTLHDVLARTVGKAGAVHCMHGRPIDYRRTGCKVTCPGGSIPPAKCTTC